VGTPQRNVPPNSATIRPGFVKICPTWAKYSWATCATAPTATTASNACTLFTASNNWINRNLLLAGNFNMTNVDELFQELSISASTPKKKATQLRYLEKIGHFLDDEVQRLHTWYKPDGYSNQDINQLIFDNLDIQRLLRRASKKFDGGYVLGGLIGHGDAFLMRDPNGIRPAYWYHGR
jgi:amidophosphoribosyltransferase